MLRRRPDYKMLSGTGHYVSAIKAVRHLTNLSLKDAKDFVDGIGTSEVQSLKVAYDLVSRPGELERVYQSVLVPAGFVLVSTHAYVMSRYTELIQLCKDTDMPDMQAHLEEAQVLFTLKYQ